MVCGSGFYGKNSVFCICAYDLTFISAESSRISLLKRRIARVLHTLCGQAPQDCLVPWGGKKVFYPLITVARPCSSRNRVKRFCIILVDMATSTSVMRHRFQTGDPALQPIADKVFARERLSFEDAAALYRSPDILAMGWLANHVRERLHGNVAYFNVNRHINPTNVCVAACRLCAFGRKKDAPGAYTMALDEAFATAASGYSEAITEFHIVGGLHPDLPFQYYLDLISGLKARFPQVHLKALTMVEIAFLSRRGKLSIEETLRQLKNAGLDSLPGGGAEIFNERVRRVICDHKIDGEEWLQTARTAHKIGLKSNATMLYGHIENEEDRADHLLRLRALQDETHGFQTFIPLAFHPANTPLQHLFATTGMLDIKQIAVSRLVLDNFPHIKAYWQMLSPKIAQISLRFGADDIDGTVVEEKIYHDAGATTPQGLVRKELERLIREAGREPVERDTMYRPVTRTETSFTISV
jgi:aminodeoxyfutalosine synthase